MIPTLSVIIPVYKVEAYLERCVMSVLMQDYTSMEVILVDDGSPDNCPQICDEMATRDRRVRVIHKSNGGLSSARNAGIEAAHGKYLVFLDSDDQWNAGKLRPLMEQVIQTEAEMIIYASLSLYEDGSIMKRNERDFFEQGFRVMKKEELYPILISRGNMMESAGTKIIRTDFIKSNNLTYKFGILGEDTEWMFRVLRIINKVAIADTPLYIYTENRAGSITQTASTKSVRDTLSVIIDSLNYYKEHPNLNVKRWELAQCAYLWSIALGHYCNVPSKDSSSLRRELKAVKKELCLSSHPKSKKVGLLYNVLGFFITSKILGLYINLHRKNWINKKVKVNG